MSYQPPSTPGAADASYVPPSTPAGQSPPLSSSPHAQVSPSTLIDKIKIESPSSPHGVLSASSPTPSTPKGASPGHGTTLPGFLSPLAMAQAVESPGTRKLRDPSLVFMQCGNSSNPSQLATPSEAAGAPSQVGPVAALRKLADARQVLPLATPPTVQTTPKRRAYVKEEGELTPQTPGLAPPRTASAAVASGTAPESQGKGNSFMTELTEFKKEDKAPLAGRSRARPKDVVSPRTLRPRFHSPDSPHCASRLSKARRGSPRRPPHFTRGGRIPRHEYRQPMILGPPPPPPPTTHPGEWPAFGQPPYAPRPLALQAPPILPCPGPPTVWTKHKVQVGAPSGPPPPVPLPPPASAPSAPVPPSTATEAPKRRGPDYQDGTKWETDPRRIAQRQKQIGYGKNTLGYERYCQKISKQARIRGYHLHTPNVHWRCPKRAWDSEVRRWRRYLHLWDESTPTQEQLFEALKRNRPKDEEASTTSTSTCTNPDEAAKTEPGTEPTSEDAPVPEAPTVKEEPGSSSHKSATEEEEEEEEEDAPVDLAGAEWEEAKHDTSEKEEADKEANKEAEEDDDNLYGIDANAQWWEY